MPEAARISEPVPAAAAVQEAFSISDLAREFGVTARTLRFYENEGILQPNWRGTTRIYSRGDRARLAWILRGRAVGFSLADIRELLDLWTPDVPRRAQIEAALAKSRDRIAALKTQRDAVDETIAELEGFCRAAEAKL